MADLKTDEKLETLKSKYQSVLNKMDQLGVRLLNIHVQDNKLILRGRAKSKTDSDKVWDQIKLVDQNYKQDLMAEFEADQGSPGGGGAQQTTYEVKSGDTLSKIAKHFYGDANAYDRIFQANRDKLSDADKIRPGQVLTIPK